MRVVFFQCSTNSNNALRCWEKILFVQAFGIPKNACFASTYFIFTLFPLFSFYIKSSIQHLFNMYLIFYIWKAPFNVYSTFIQSFLYKKPHLTLIDLLASLIAFLLTIGVHKMLPELASNFVEKFSWAGGMGSWSGVVPHQLIACISKTLSLGCIAWQCAKNDETSMDN